MLLGWNGSTLWLIWQRLTTGLPDGGTTGQVLAKASNTNYDNEWIDASSVGVSYPKLISIVSLGV